MISNYDIAEDLVKSAGKASTSYLQRKMQIDYAEAAKLIDRLEENGIIGSPNGAAAREVFYD